MSLGVIAANKRRGGGGGGWAAPIDPATLSPYMYWDVSDGATLFSDAGVTAAVNGGPVARITDKAGNASRYLDQPTSSKQPTLVAPGGGAKPYIDLAGDDWMMTNGLVNTLPQPYTLFAAVLIENTSGSQGVIFWSRGAQVLLRAGGSNVYELFLNSSINGGARDTAAHTIVAVADGANSRIEVDGVGVASGNPGATSLVNGVYLGVTSSETGQFLDGRFYAGGVIPSALSAGDRAGLASWLRDKAGIP